MKAVIQRVSKASVSVDNKITGEIEKGLLILLGVKEGDKKEDAEVLANKIANLRIFSDSNDKMNLSLLNIGGSALVISNFTLLADTKKGRRPNFINAAKPKEAEELYEYFTKLLLNIGVKTVEKGVFGAAMEVSLINDGPVTITINSDDLI